MSTNKNPFFTIVVPAYNCQAFILETIASVEQQTFKDWELIVVEDHSRDNTLQVVQEYIADKQKMRLVQTEKNSGSPGRPRDVGVQFANGQFIGFLDGDDQYAPEKLERHYQAIQRKKDIEFIHTSCDIISEKGQFLHHQPLKWFLKLYMWLFPMRSVCILSNPFNISTTVIKKDIITNYPFAVTI